MKRRFFFFLGFLGIASLFGMELATAKSPQPPQRGVVRIIPAYDKDLPVGETWQVGS